MSIKNDVLKWRWFKINHNRNNKDKEWFYEDRPQYWFMTLIPISRMSYLNILITD